MALSGFERVLGRVRGARPGPTLVAVGGVHGNEPSGVRAIGRVLDALAADPGRLTGTFVGLAGNRRALDRGVRYVDRDLNRAWTVDRLAALTGEGPAGPVARTTEDEEQAELLQALRRIEREAAGPVYALDLHTTSGPGGLFTTVSDTLANRDYALALPVPLIVGLEELVDGTLLEYLGRRRWTAAVFEGGQHEEPEAVERHEDALWVALAKAGVIEPDAPRVHEARARLAEAARGLPPALEMRYRHPVSPGDGFRMLPGFRNF
ncbi:MAG: aspartoacylase, partial [Gemmatimonadetes bacterium]